MLMIKIDPAILTVIYAIVAMMIVFIGGFIMGSM
jgi:hypothetical protein